MVRFLATVLGGLSLLLAGGCSGGTGSSPDKDLGDLFVVTTSLGNGDELDTEDSNDDFNALNNPTVTNPGAVTLVFTTSVEPTSVLNLDPADPQGTRNVRLFFFDTSQGPFDPQQPTVPGVNPPGANVLVKATSVLTSTNVTNDTLIIRPTGISATNPLPEGQYSVVVENGVKGADGDSLKGREYFFFFRVGPDNLGPVVITSSPAPGGTGVDPTAEIRVTMSETILASSVNSNTITVSFQPAGAATPIAIPGTWFADGGNGPGNNFPNLQLDFNGDPGRSGTSPRNGVDLVFQPSTTSFPVNMTAEDPFDPFCTQFSDPLRKGNKGYPLGNAITVTFVTTGLGVTDTAGNAIPGGSPNTTFTFQTKDRPDPPFAPNSTSSVYYGDTIGVGVIDVDPARTPFIIGPNPARSPNSVVTAGSGAAQRIVRVPINGLVDMKTDTRPYTSFYNFVCSNAGAVRYFSGNVFAASQDKGGEVVVIDTWRMVPLGTFGTASPGGVTLTAIGNTGRLCISNFSANTVTGFDIGDVRWFTGATLFQTQGGLANAVLTGGSQLILSPADFKTAFPSQRSGPTSPPGPPIIGTIITGISPAKMTISGLPNSMGVLNIFCPSLVLTNNTILCTLNVGESTADFSEFTNLSQSEAIQPDLRGVTLSSKPTDVAWISDIGPEYYVITAVGGTAEVFVTGFLANQPSVRGQASQNFAPNNIVGGISGLVQPTAVQMITSGNASSANNGYSLAVLIAETGENRLQQIAVTARFPSILIDTINQNHPSGLGPVDITGDPAAAVAFTPCSPRFTIYYVANAGEGTVRSASYQGGVIGAEIPVPGVTLVASWWSR